jgi:hypothetical protein
MKDSNVTSELPKSISDFNLTEYMLDACKSLGATRFILAKQNIMLSQHTVESLLNINGVELGFGKLNIRSVNFEIVKPMFSSKRTDNIRVHLPQFSINAFDAAYTYSSYKSPITAFDEVDKSAKSRQLFCERVKDIFSYEPFTNYNTLITKDEVLLIVVNVAHT